MAKDSKHIWDDRHNIVLLLRGFFSICVLLFAVDLVVHKKAHMPWEAWPGFYAIFGFVACVLLVLLAKYVLRPVVKRDENYYDN